VKPKRQRGKHVSSAALGLLLLGMTTVALLFLLLSLGHTYVLTDGTRSQSIRLYPGTVQKACDRTGFNAQRILQQSERGRTTYLQFGEPLYADIHRGTETLSVPFQPCTVRELLQSNGIAWKDSDSITPALDARLTADTDIQIVSVSYETVVEYQDIAFGVQSQPSTYLTEGKKRVIREGVNGVKEVTYQVERHDGAEVARTVQAERLLVEPLDCIIEKGVSKPKPPTVKKKQAPPEPLPTVGETERLQAAAAPSQSMAAASSSTPSAGSNPSPVPATANQKPASGASGAASTSGVSEAPGETETPQPSEIWQTPVFIVDYVQTKTLIRKDGDNLSYSDVREGQAVACCIGEIDQPAAKREMSEPPAITASSSDDATDQPTPEAPSIPSDDATPQPDQTEQTNVEAETDSPATPTNAPNVSDMAAIPYTTAAYGSVLVDPKAIPVGCRVLVVSHDDKRNWAYGPCETVDSKGVVEGDAVGLLFLTEEETQLFGTCAAHVYILADTPVPAASTNE